MAPFIKQIDNADALPPYSGSREVAPYPVPRGGLDWRALAVLCFFLLIGGLLAWWLVGADVREWIQYGAGRYVVYATLAIGLGFGVRRLLLIEQPGGYKVFFWQARTYDVGRFIEVQTAHAATPGRLLAQQTYSPTITHAPRDMKDAIEGEIVAERPMLAITAAGGPLLQQLRSRAQRSGEHLLVGFVGETPIYLRWKIAGLSAVAGGSGSGKTNTTRLIAAWHALNGGGLALCDGHGEVPEESLIQSCQSLSEGLILPAAITEDAIYMTIRRMDAIGRARIQGTEPPDVPLLLIIDEFTSICRNHSKAAEIVNMLLNFADEYRKANMQALIIGHHWRGDLIDAKLGAALRSAIGTRIIHGTAPDEAKFLLRAIEAQGVDKLRTGEALFFDRSADVQKIVVPYVPAEALKEMAYPPHPGWPLDLATPAEQQLTPRQRSLERVRQQLINQPRDMRLAAAHKLASQGAKQTEIAHGCILSDEAAGAIWRQYHPAATAVNGTH